MNLKIPPELWIFLLSPHWEGLGLQARTYVSGFGGTGDQIQVLCILGKFTVAELYLEA